MPPPANETEQSGETDTAQFVEATIKRCSQIATLPVVAVQILRLSEDPDSTIEDLNEVITNDPVLGVRILKLVNSAYYGMQGQVDSIKRALLMLGLQAVKNIAIAASLVKLFRGGRITKEFDPGELWIHSIAVAGGARLLARQSGAFNADEAFLAGLIHDMGIMFEMQADGPNFALVIQRVSFNEDLKFRLAEQEVLRASHEEFGAGMCRAWNFPATLQRVTGFHHRPWELDEAHRQLPALVHIADILAAKLGLGYKRTVETDVIDPQLLRFVGLTEIDLDATAAALPAAMQEIKLLLSL